MASSLLVVENAWKRASDNKRSRIEGLASELQLLIIENLPDCSSVVNLALTGPRLYSLVMGHEANLAGRAVVSAIGKHLMPFAAAIYELGTLGDRLPWAVKDGDHREPPPGSLIPVINTLNRHIGLDNTDNWHKESRITKFSVALKYSKMHAIVDYWAQILAPGALDRACRYARRRIRNAWDTVLTPTETEMARFHKALYVFQLLVMAFPWESPEEGQHTEAWHRLCAQLAPWEMGQVRSLHALLANHLPCTMKILNKPVYLRNDIEHWRIIYGFVFHQGLPNLYRIHKEGPDGVNDDEIYRIYGESIRYPYTLNSRSVSLPMTLDTDKFEYDADGSSRLVADEIFKRYPEEERGPKTWWYYRLLWRLALFDFNNWRYQAWFKCGACSPGDGYSFWDFETMCKLSHRDEQYVEISSLLQWAQGRRPLRRSSVYDSIKTEQLLSLQSCSCQTIMNYTERD